jgi:hypothetical protein
LGCEELGKDQAGEAELFRRPRRKLWEELTVPGGMRIPVSFKELGEHAGRQFLCPG